MCDTVVALSECTAEGSTLFGKNSDRQRNEAQAVEMHPAADHDAFSELRCTYISIPQVARTYAVLLCRPFWIWGAEMGANEHGVVIGNEGFAARNLEPAQEALTGMDLVRLALERACTASEAVEVITSLLERHGQGGNCGHLTPAYYHNGFIVADAYEAFVVETVGRDWLTERVSGIRAISNTYSIDRAIDRTSAGLQQLLQEIAPEAVRQSYPEALADPARRHIGDSEIRRQCSTAMLNARRTRLVAADVMAVLRDHGSGDFFENDWSAECTQDRRTLCMHAGPEQRPGQTVGSMVSEIRNGSRLHWVTGTAAPCISIFKPVLLNVPMGVNEPELTARFDPRTSWWRHEQMHRAALKGDFAAFLRGIRGERDLIEADFSARMSDVLLGGDAADMARVVSECWRDAHKLEATWHARTAAATRSPETPHALEWQRLNELAGIPNSV